VTAPTRIVQNTGASRYEAWVGDDLVGFVDYRLAPGRIVFTHAETAESWRGEGVAGRLAAGVLDDARAQGLAVTPRCPFIADFIRQHPDYEDLVASSTGPA
jgi:predicted GNAT family acetyltransferase